MLFYVKREDLNHSGAHKLNHCMRKALPRKAQEIGSNMGEQVKISRCDVFTQRRSQSKESAEPSKRRRRQSTMRREWEYSPSNLFLYRCPLFFLFIRFRLQNQLLFSVRGIYGNVSAFPFASVVRYDSCPC